MKLTTKIKVIIKILTAFVVLANSMRTMTRGLRETSRVLIITTSALVTMAAFLVTPCIREEIKARKVLS